MSSWVLWRRIEHFFLTHACCRHCNFWYFSSICWAYFSYVMVSLGFRNLYWIRPPADHQTVTMTFFWCKSDFGKCFGASSQLKSLVGCYWLSYKIHFSLHITIWSRNGLLLHRIREDNTSKQQFFGFLVSSWDTHLLSFFTFPIFFKCRTTEELTVSSSAASHIVVSSASMMLSVGHCQLVMASHYAPHLQGSHLLCKTSWTTTALYVC